MKETGWNHMNRPHSSDGFTEEIAKRNVSVWDHAAATWRQIPIAMEPVLVTKSSWEALVADGRTLLSSFPPVLDWLQLPENRSLFHHVFDGLRGLELDAAGAPPASTWGHATIRLDLFWEGDDLKIIEANCTIPAMQAYSDLVRAAWGEATGMAVAELNALGRWNTPDLLDSLLSLYRHHGGEAVRPRLAIFHREGDSQLAELLHFEKSWQDRCDIVRVTPENISRQAHDLVYRHIFAHRVQDNAAIAALLRTWRQVRMFNPVSAHYEVKAFLAVVSSVAENEGLAARIGLSPSQRHVIRNRVPWTCLMGSLLPGTGFFPCHKSHEDVLRDWDQFVFKSSSGYGGHAVFIGSEWRTPATQERLRALLAVQDPVTEKDFLAWVARPESGTWVIQQRVSGRRHRSAVITSSRDIIEVDGYVDASVFLNTGPVPLCGGGVSRFAAGPVVNIGTGGGLAPFLVC
jgi:hypothetical protein